MVPAMQAVTGPGCVVDGRYQLLDRIGRGAMGTVWRARDLVLARDVAVKEVRLPDLMSDRERTILRERTLREAKVSAKLSHPCVVTVYDVIESDGAPWIVMELVAARSLQRVLAEDGPLPPPQAAETGMMLLGALASAHAVGIVHRDVKPGNVLLTRGGRAVLTDFGIAVVDGDPALTLTGMVMGTPGFCAPERIRGEPASPASDLWSLGATLYAAVEGRTPFDGHGSPMAVLASIVHSDPPPARSAGPLTAVIGALLNKDPARRPDAACASRMLADAAATSRATAGIGASQGYAGARQGYAGVRQGYVSAGQGYSSAGQGYAGAGRNAVGAAQGYVGAAQGYVGAGQGYPSAGAGPTCADAGLGPASADPLGASARTDPTGFPASAPTASPARPGRATFPAGPAPHAPLACPPSLPFADGTGTAQFPAGAGQDFFPPDTGPTPLPAGMSAAPRPASTGATPPRTSTGATPPPASMGAAPLLASTGAAPPRTSIGTAPLPAGPGAGTGAAGRSGTRPTPGRRSLALGLAGAAIVVAGLAAGLMWSRMTGPPAHGVADRPAPARGTGGAPVAAAPLPAGYRWYTRSAVPAGTAPGFMMAVPAGWQARQQGTTTYLRNATSGGIISVSRPPLAVSGPVREARALERAALGRGSFAGYRRIAITPFVLRGKLAGAWRFTYRQPGTGAMDGLVVVTPGGAPGNGQPYELMATAPAAYWPHTRTVFAEAIRTFSPRG
jgi:tRNA A-37 threonylcarbamoyl transferase component Bud32